MNTKQRDITFAEVAGEEPLDWNKELDTPATDVNRWLDLQEFSESWVTCACGNQCAIIPRVDNEPVDGMLRTLGIEFCNCVTDIADLCHDERDWTGDGGPSSEDFDEEFALHVIKAKDVLLQIEIRSQQIINELSTASVL